MSVKIYNSTIGAFKDAETPLIWDEQAQAWKDSFGLVWNESAQAWEERWSGNKVYLYNQGNEFVSVTGGYTVTWRDARGNGSVTNKAQYLELYYVDDSIGRTAMSIGSSKKVDVTNYSKLFIEYESDGFGSLYFGLDDNTNSVSVKYGAEQVAASTIRTLNSIDISSISGKKYLKWYGWGKKASSGSTMIVYKIWLEK